MEWDSSFCTIVEVLFWWLKVMNFNVVTDEWSCVIKVKTFLLFCFQEHLGLSRGLTELHFFFFHSGLHHAYTHTHQTAPKLALKTTSLAYSLEIYSFLCVRSDRHFDQRLLKFLLLLRLATTRNIKKPLYALKANWMYYIWPSYMKICIFWLQCTEISSFCLLNLFDLLKCLGERLLFDTIVILFVYNTQLRINPREKVI